MAKGKSEIKPGKRLTVFHLFVLLVAAVVIFFSLKFIEYLRLGNRPYDGTPVLVSEDGQAEYVPDKTFFQWLTSPDKENIHSR